FKRFINFSQPETFNEKLQVRKIIDHNPLFTVAADKIASKDWVKSICSDIYIPRNLWIGSDTNDIESIDFSLLPRDYVFKANHTSQTIEIIRNNNHISQRKMIKLASKWLKHDQSSSLGEWAYKDIPRRVFIEEFLDFEGSAPDDYKFFVFNGRVEFIQLDSDRFINHKRNMFDRNWRDLNFEYSHEMKIPSPPKPIFLDEMIRISELIGENFDFVRVDLYFYNNKVTFGELTIYPGAGFEKFPCIELDKLFGKYWTSY
ncbi:hypothetical protein CTM94_05240, partial [Photobacterium leiognathi]